MTVVSSREQLEALSQLHQLLRMLDIDYWVFGGWAVDLHAGRVTREHGDLDVAAWSIDRDRIDAVLVSDGWEHTPAAGEDGYTAYERRGVRIDLAWLVVAEDGTVYTPLREGRGTWPEGAFGDDVGEVEATQARVIGLAALDLDKSQDHGDERAAAKDRVDREVLAPLLRGA
jgi:hypothetical protein